MITAWRYRPSARPVSTSRSSAARRGNARCPDSPGGSPMAFGSGTRRNSGIEKTSHQTATERNGSRMGSVAWAGVRPSPDGSPNHSGLEIQARLSARSTPPPR